VDFGGTVYYDEARRSVAGIPRLAAESKRINLTRSPDGHAARPKRFFAKRHLRRWQAFAGMLPSSGCDRSIPSRINLTKISA
jgi:hypothetical protein